MNALLFLSAPVGLIVGIPAAVLVLFIIILFAVGYVKAAPDTAIIISGLGIRKI